MMGGKGSGRVAVKCIHGIGKSSCKSCKSAADRARNGSTSKNAINPKVFVRDYKISLKHCVICETKININNYMMFALDHRDPQQKLFNLSKARSYKLDVILAECLKCELMCHNCHHLKTHRNGDHVARKDDMTKPDEYLPLLLLMQDAE